MTAEIVTNEGVDLDAIEPQFSVIIPTHDRPDLLRAAVRSVCAQLVTDIEIIVVDDASTEPVAPFDDHRVRVIRLPVQKGPAGSRNAGLDVARGRFVAFLDDDDLWVPERLDLALRGLRTAPVAVCWAKHIGRPDGRHRLLAGDVGTTVVEDTTPCLGTTAVLRSLAPRFDETFKGVEDMVWWWTLAQRATVATVPQVGCLIRLHPPPRGADTIAVRVEESIRLLRTRSDIIATRRASAHRWLRVGILASEAGDHGTALSAFVQHLRARPRPRALGHVTRAAILAARSRLSRPSIAAPTTEAPTFDTDSARELLDQIDLVVLVHRDSPEVVHRSCRALEVSMGRDWSGHLVLVENGSRSRTSTAARVHLARSFPSARITSVVSRRNRGFAGGVNLGMVRTSAPYVGVFNPDGATRPDTIAQLAAALERDPGALAAGARVLAKPGDETHQEEGVRAVDWLPGTATVYRRDAFLELGGFDPAFFMYCEDVDLSRRARNNGWRLLLVTDALFDHTRSFHRVEELRRIRMWTASNTKLVYQYAPSRRRALVRLAKQRAVWFRDLARDRRFWTLAGAMLGSVGWSASLVQLERRRRQPWDSGGLDTWLRTADPGLRATELLLPPNFAE